MMTILIIVTTIRRWSGYHKNDDIFVRDHWRHCSVITIVTTLSLTHIVVVITADFVPAVPLSNTVKRAVDILTTKTNEL